MSAVGPNLTPQRRDNAVRAYHALPVDDRKDVLALARQGRRHPDERVAAVAWWYAAAVLQPRWWNRMSLAVLPVVALALLAVALITNFWPFAFLGLVVMLVGAGLGWQRMTTIPLLRLMSPAATSGPTG
ncbi:MAG: hypothetical protein ACRYF3_08455 [Janthinobacterium lividum]